MSVAIASSSRTASTSNDTSIVLTKPTGLAVGDILLAFIFTDNGGGSTPSGWTAIGGTAVAEQFDLQLKTYAKIADSSDVAASDFTFTITLDNLRLGYLFRVTGDFSSGTLTDYIVSDTDSSITPSGTTVTYPGGVTTISPNSLLVMGLIGGKSLAATGTPFSSFAVANSNPSWTTSYNEAMPGGGVDSIQAAVVYSTYTTAQATGDYSATESADNALGGKLIAIAETTNASVTGTTGIINVQGIEGSVTGEANVAGATGVINVVGNEGATTITASKWKNTAKSSAGTITNTPKS